MNDLGTIRVNKDDRLRNHGANNGLSSLDIEQWLPVSGWVSLGSIWLSFQFWGACANGKNLLCPL